MLKSIRKCIDRFCIYLRVHSAVKEELSILQESVVSGTVNSVEERVASAGSFVVDLLNEVDFGSRFVYSV